MLHTYVDLRRKRRVKSEIMDMYIGSYYPTASNKKIWIRSLAKRRGFNSRLLEALRVISETVDKNISEMWRYLHKKVPNWRYEELRSKLESKGVDKEECNKIKVSWPQTEGVVDVQSTNQANQRLLELQESNPSEFDSIAVPSLVFLI